MPRRNLALAALLLVAGPVVVLAGIPNVLDALRSGRWPRVEGLVVQSGIVAGGSRGSQSYKPLVSYEYTVDGTTYQSFRIGHGDAVAKTKPHAEQIAAKYPTGASVEVAYDPTDPALAVLEPGFHALALALPGFGLALTAAGGAMLVLGRRRSYG